VGSHRIGIRGIDPSVWRTDLPLHITHADALARANRIAEKTGYRVIAKDDTQLEVIGHGTDDHLLVTFDNQQGRIIDIEAIANPDVPAFVPASDLLDQLSRERLPPLYSGEQLGLDALVQVKFFTPDGNWTWYASEGSPVDEDGYFDTDKEKVDFLFFGLVIGFEIELGYFALSELSSARGALGLPIERDQFFTPTTLRELKAKHEQERRD
jgi:hypothetical protein